MLGVRLLHRSGDDVSAALADVDVVVAHQAYELLAESRCPDDAVLHALVAAGLCIAAGEDAARVLHALEKIIGAAGRLQRGSGGRGEAYVDYAHTPDGLETVLKALRPHAAGRLIVVFGAGGDRDKGKRPLMGEIAGRLADIAIVTDDNPRSENPAVIRAEVRAGVLRMVPNGSVDVSVMARRFS